MGGIALALGGYRAVEIVLPGFALIGGALILIGRQSSLAGAPSATEASLLAEMPVGAPGEGRAQIADEA